MADCEKDEKTGKCKGRPREFDMDDALAAAMQVFWDKGYEGASLPELTEAMGINRPSMYAAFGNKEALFRKVVDRYATQAGAFLHDKLSVPHVRDAIENLFRCVIGNPKKASQARGCLLVHAGPTCCEEGSTLKADIARIRSQGEQHIIERLEKAEAEGEVKAGTDVHALAKFIVLVQQGISVQLDGGAKREDLLNAVKVAMGAVDDCLASEAAKSSV